MTSISPPGTIPSLRSSGPDEAPGASCSRAAHDLSGAATGKLCLVEHSNGGRVVTLELQLAPPPSFRSNRVPNRPLTQPARYFIRPSGPTNAISRPTPKSDFLLIKRFEGQGIHCNAQMTTSQLRKYCLLDDPSQTLLKNAMEKFGLSPRAYDRILKVARTIADLDNEDVIQTAYIAEAIQYRNLDRSVWRN